ncbi:MAG: sulfite exporter TauE/SafE family protein [Deltaproteobacteria bacterium]|nr:sulfite exporter TauE/SafE family protein [Deltaproteobacteria bacterium]
MGATPSFLGGLLLGLASGPHCFWSCALVLGPYLVTTEGGADGARFAQLPARARTLLWYNLGRFLAYLAAATVVSAAGAELRALPASVGAATRLASAALLLLCVLRQPAPLCGARAGRFGGAFGLGLLQGLVPCPPFVSAVGLALAGSSVPGSALLFAGLFLGTALYTLPLALLEPLARWPWLSRLGRVAGLLVALYLGATGAALLWSAPVAAPRG